MKAGQLRKIFILAVDKGLGNWVVSVSTLWSCIEMMVPQRKGNVFGKIDSHCSKRCPDALRNFFSFLQLSIHRQSLLLEKRYLVCTQQAYMTLVRILPFDWKNDVVLSKASTGGETFILSKTDATEMRGCSAYGMIHQAVSASSCGPSAARGFPGSALDLGKRAQEVCLNVYNMPICVEHVKSQMTSVQNSPEAPLQIFSQDIPGGTEKARSLKDLHSHLGKLRTYYLIYIKTEEEILTLMKSVDDQCNKVDRSQG
ncbi:hypothetical protein ACRRTK_022941 [Alexandromys fortis]